jgi:transposase
MWRGSLRLGLACLFPPLSSGGALVASAITPFPHPPHRTGRADLPHPALGQYITPSHTPRYAPARSQPHEPEVPVEVREGIGPAPASPDLVLVA